MVWLSSDANGSCVCRQAKSRTTDSEAAWDVETYLDVKGAHGSQICTLNVWCEDPESVTLDWYLHWKIGHKGRPHWRPETVADMKRKKINLVSSYFITFPSIPRKEKTVEGVIVIHINSAESFCCDSRLEIHHSPYVVSLELPLPFIFSSSAFSNVCLLLCWLG